MAYSIQLLYTSVPALIALKLTVLSSHARPSTTKIISRVEIPQENLSFHPTLTEKMIARLRTGVYELGNNTYAVMTYPIARATCYTSVYEELISNTARVLFFQN